ncbi:22091_t:CDS:2, partial [Cetraspora pellucida]
DDGRAKNSPTYSFGLAKYKISQELSQIIKFKYFFSTNQSPQIFTNDDIVFIAGKYIVENFEPCFTITYSSIVDMVINQEPKEITNFIHFGAETIEYNSVTSPSGSNIKLQSTYFISATDIDYLRTSSINIITSKSSSLMAFDKPSIIDIIDDDIDSTVIQPKQHVEFSSSSQDINQPFDTNIHNQKTAELDKDANSQDDIEDLDEEA